MVSLQDQVLLNINAKNNASNAANQIDKDFQGMASNIQSALSSIGSGMTNFSAVTDNMMQGLTGKSAIDNILGTTSKAETNSVLLKNMLDDTEKHYDAFYEKVDKTTDSSLTSMQELIPALKAFKSATGATDKEMTNITDEMANFGAAVLAQTGSTDLAQQSMMDLSKGVKGAFASLDQYGITQDALERTGYWNGDEKDVEGFMKAVQKVTGSTEELMETNTGLDALIGKAFSRAGKKMGNEFLPWIKDIKRGFLDLDTELGGNLTASMLAVSGGVEAMNQGLWNVSTTVQGVKDLKEGLSSIKDIGKGVIDSFKGASDVVEGAGQVAETTGGLVQAGTAIGAEGAEAAAASVAVEETAVATTSLSASFTAMITPLLAASAVIAIMIPIAAGLAAEALVFLKAIQMVFEALDFGGIDLSDDIEGIKQLAEGLAWVGVAMGAMSFASVMTGLAAITGGFLGITGPLQMAVDALTEAGSLMSEFSSMGIDPSVPKNLKNLSESLSSVSDAMMALTGTTVTTGFSNFVSWVFGFSSTTDALGQAKDDLIKASTAINELATGIEPLPEEDAAKIQNVCDSLASVGDAIGALRSIRDGQNWDDIFGGLMEGLFGEGVDIQQALKNVKTDIAKAATALKDWNIEEIPEGVGDKVKAVADTLTSLSESFEALRSLRDSVNWDDFVGGIFGGTDIQGALTSVKTELYYTANNLKGLEGLPEVSEDVGTKIKTITDTVSSVSEAANGLTSVPDMGEYDPANLSTAVTNVQNAATELSRLNETTFSADTASGVLGSISSTIETLKTTLSSASGFTEPATSIGSQIVSGVQSGIAPLGSSVQGAVSSAISSASGTATTGGNTLGTNVTTGLKSTLQLKSTMETEVGYALTAMTSRTQEFYDAGAALGQAANQGFQSHNAINPGSPGNLAHVMMDEVGYILGAMTDKYGVARKTASGLGESIYYGFGNPNLSLNSSAGGRLTVDDVDALNTLTSQVPQSQGGKTIIMYNNVTVDARNKTEKEAKSLMTLALEGMDNITDINVDV